MSGLPERLVRVIVWSAGFALLSAAVLGLVRGWDSILQPAVVGAMLGAIMGATEEELITRWTEGAFLGAVLGVIAGGGLWLSADHGEGMLSLPLTLLVSAIGSAMVGAILTAFNAPK